MKTFLFNLSVFLKRINILMRIVILGAVLLVLFIEVIPDIKFNLVMKNPKKLTIEEIQTLSKEEIPRYIVVDNAQLMKVGTSVSDSQIDSLSHGTIKVLKESPLKLVSYSYNYLTEQKIKNKAAIPTLLFNTI